MGLLPAAFEAAVYTYSSHIGKKLVGLEGVEPTRQKTTASKTVAAASYATDRNWSERGESNSHE